MDATMGIHMALHMQISRCLAIGHLERSIELADWHGGLLRPLGSWERLVIREAIDVLIVLVEHFEIVLSV